MSTPTTNMQTPKVTSRRFNKTTIPSLQEFQVLTSQTTSKATYPLASHIEKNVPIYNCSTFSLTNTTQIDAVQDEFYHILLSGPGVFVLQNFFQPPHTPIETANTAFSQIINAETSPINGTTTTKKGDHFAPSSPNSRIWNSFSKHCLTDPASFLEYYSNPWFAVVCEAYLGPAYRITSQVNIVRPGRKAQVSHRDYHLGFQSEDRVARWPKEVHAASALLTLQGAVAHSDMPVESGPTRLLPFSQMFEGGYVAYRKQEFVEDFLQRYVCLELKKGDAIFFSPALFHAAGENRTRDVERSANLIQVSSAFGKPMETIDALPLVERTWAGLSDKYAREGMSLEVAAFINAVAEGYPFPTNLDRRPPAPGGMAPESEQELLVHGLNERWDTVRVVDELRTMRQDSAA